MFFRLIFTLIFSLCGQLQAQSVAAENPDQKMAEDFQKVALEPGAVIFIPPEGWRPALPKSLPPNTRAMVVGQGESKVPPSINLSTEEFSGSVKDYLKIIKDINHARKSEWKDLGRIRTQAGDASLSQTDSVTEWGAMRMMHVILLKNGIIHILTAAALKSEFPKYYKVFFESLRSLRINQDPDEMAQGNHPIPLKMSENNPGPTLG